MSEDHRHAAQVAAWSRLWVLLLRVPNNKQQEMRPESREATNADGDGQAARLGRSAQEVNRS